MELLWVLLIALAAFSASYWLGERLEARQKNSDGPKDGCEAPPSGAAGPPLPERCLYAAEEYLSGRVPEEQLPGEAVRLAAKMLEVLEESPASQALALLERLSQRRR